MTSLIVVGREDFLHGATEAHDVPHLDGKGKLRFKKFASRTAVVPNDKAAAGHGLGSRQAKSFRVAEAQEYQRFLHDRSHFALRPIDEWNDVPAPKGTADPKDIDHLEGILLVFDERKGDLLFFCRS
jgi:hypothetical protein